MSRPSHLRRLVAPTLLLLFAAAPLHAQNADPTGEHAAKLFEQALPHLEAVLGSKLQRLPQFRGVTVEQLRTQTDPELIAYLRWQFPTLQGDTFQNTLHVARCLSTSAAVVERNEGSGVIAVLPEPQREEIERWDDSLEGVATRYYDSLKGVATPAFLQLAVVHETVRWLLEQEYDLPARRKATRDGEEYHALQALVEGRAQWVTYQVAKRLGNTAYFPKLAQRFLRAPEIGSDGALRAISQKALRQRHWAYTQGMAFFAHLEQTGVKDAEKVVFTHPPQQISAINRPELYVRALQTPHGDLTTTLAKLQNALPETEWNALQQPWTAAMVSQVAGLLGERATADRVLAGWDEGRSLVWLRKGNAAQHVALNVVHHQSKSAAGLYFEFVVALQRKRDGGTACGPSFRVLEAKSSAVKLPGVDEAVRTDKRIEVAPGTPPVTVTTLLVRAADVVLECSWNGVAADADWAEHAVSAVLADFTH